MSLHYHAANVARSLRIRDRLERAGFTDAGVKVWTESELELVRQFSSDYGKLCQLLPHRTRKAIRGKAGQLGLTKKRHCWTGSDLVTLRKLYANTSMEEVERAFPGLSRPALRQRAARIGVTRPRRQYYVTGISSIDQIRAKCFEIRWTMVDLDKASRTKKYFRGRGWSGRKVNHRAVGLAIDALAGQIDIKWLDTE